ncbi:pentatricopeptide repeat-containing protein At2g17210 [Cornus florida]|uniref:pentatricopeptide repeat-containing protein At2g17210 n=1 Tax=Cornus florida TaxID=4283 RepID=UPI00289B9DFE|nr:pentatricopeptide repeat-containing protein At2g17210 [Cornus florida]XP_059648084.1 pentatricopeptide repeat-containing protein At2g17210 [Cornus florida]XP_059648085.1 pentatricopeptide repeat-containing protein At2g17210 [Cornus florida]XP_059648087.1 pentatricopeptide repeat-containing protein At2g17210 [Cornus florida]XP_059648088.1 pentatricopeptide repeat-containing protein At2g17210 [Cornus florida]
MRLPITFSSLKLPNWFLRIKESSYSEKWQEVFSHYNGMMKAGVQLTDPSLFPPILKACLELSCRHGLSIHACLVKRGFESFTSIGNSVMDFYVKSDALDSAMRVFSYMRNRDSVSWNIIIHGHLDLGDSVEGLLLFKQGRVAGFEPNTATLVLVIQACRSVRAIREGLKIHGYIIRSGFWAITSVQNSLLSMYAYIEMEFASKLFDEMYDRDVISWSVMIGGYVQSEEDQIAFWLFREMVYNFGAEVDAQTMVSVLKASNNLRDISMGRLVHGFVIRRGFNNDLFVGNSLVDMYFKCNDAGSAFKTFNEMPRRNIVSWNSLLSGFVGNEKHSEAPMIYASMRKAGFEADAVTLVNLLQTCKHFVDTSQCKSIHATVIRRGYELNELVMNSLINAYAKCNIIMLAWRLFNQMKRRDTVTWSTMIAAFAYCGMPDEAIAVFQQMYWVHEKPNMVTMLNLLEACSVSAELKRSKWAHGIAIRRGLAAEVAVGTAILDMYSKCGAVEASRKAFDQIPKKNIVSWSAMIGAYGMNGFASDALALLAEMKSHGLKPNPVTMLSVLSACSHGGLVEEGLAFFEELVQDRGTELGLEHYSCMVDLFGRAGKLDNAMDFIKKMPERLKPGASAWGALLSACRSHGNSELGAGAVSRVLELEPSNSAGYLLASSMYAAAGLWNDASRMRWLVKEKRVGVVAGYSLVNVDNKPCRFVAGDKYHPLSDDICLTVEQLHSCMKLDERNIEAAFAW